MKTFIFILSLVCSITLSFLLYTQFKIKSNIELLDQLTKNDVPVSNYYYILMTDNKNSDLLGNLQTYNTLSDKTIKKYKKDKHIYKIEKDDMELNYHFENEWLFLVPYKQLNVPLDDKYVIDIFIKDINKLKDYYIKKRFISYEIIKLESYIVLEDLNEKYENKDIDYDIKRINIQLEANKKLKDIGVSINLDKNNY